MHILSEQHGLLANIMFQNINKHCFYIITLNLVL